VNALVPTATLESPVVIAVPAFFPNNVLFSGLDPLKLAPASVPAIVLPCASLVTPPLIPERPEPSPA